MIFCGQCGFQIPPGIVRCPRCGTAVDTTANVGGEAHTDDPTVASPSLRTGQPSLPGMPPAMGPSTPNNQQRLVLRPGTNNPDYNTQQQAYDATSRVDAANYQTNTPSYPGYGNQGVSNYQTQNVPPNYTQQSGGNYQTHNQPFLGAPQQGQYGSQQEAIRRNNRGRNTGLVLILLGLVFILGAIVLFTMQHHNQSTSGSSTSAGSTGQQPSSTQQAQAVIQQYYDDINKHDYTSAYALWKNNQQSLADFTAGYQNTLHDQLTFNQIAQQTDGTVKITVTVSATERAASGGQKQSTYHINYAMTQQTDNTWKITSGALISA